MAQPIKRIAKFEESRASSGAQRNHQAAMVPAQDIGRGAPLGATVGYGGVNFSLYSRDASRIELLFFDREDDVRPVRVILLDPLSTVPTTTGMCSSLACRQGSSTDIGFMGRLIPFKGFGLTLPKSCSTHMVAGS